MNSRGRVLVVDDEKDLVGLLRYHLERDGFEVRAAATGEEGLNAALDDPPAVVVLDRSLPSLDGLEVCRRLRQDPRTARVPIVLLTARAAEFERVAGLEAGADDYMSKPFSPRELVARIKAVLRRVALRPAPLETLEVGPLLIDVGRHVVTVRGTPVRLTAGEFRILRFLALRQGRVVSRSEIIDGALDGHVDGLSRTVDVHLAAIRRKLGRGAGLIHTVRGVGYRLAEPALAARERSG
jgi:DNA-binding response OmpR family regulator